MHINIKIGVITSMFILSFASLASAHGDHRKKQAESSPLLAEKTAVEKINQQYSIDVKPIFQRSCFDCHSSATRFPWYAKLPGVKQWIQRDITEAREHLDLENDFPFESHAEPLEDLEEIDKVIVKGEMPPLRYRLMHPQSALSKEEKEIVHQWVQYGKEVLKENRK